MILNYLQLSCQVFMLPPYFESPGKRLVKSPKLYWIDPGLWRYQTGYWGEASGTLLEGYDEDAITFPQYYRVTVGPPATRRWCGRRSTRLERRTDRSWSLAAASGRRMAKRNYAVLSRRPVYRS